MICNGFIAILHKFIVNFVTICNVFKFIARCDMETKIRKVKAENRNGFSPAHSAGYELGRKWPALSKQQPKKMKRNEEYDKFLAYLGKDIIEYFIDSVCEILEEHVQENGGVWPEYLKKQG